MDCSFSGMGPLSPFAGVLCVLWYLLTETWVGAALLLLAFLWVAGFLFRSGWDSAGKKGGKANP